MKKTTAFILTVLLIIPLISVQGFALFDKITDVKITECEQFSYRMIEECLKEIEEDGDTESEGVYEYWVFCEAEVTISTGEVIKTNDMGYGTSENKKRNVEVYTYVDMRECKKAFENGENKVPLYINVTLTSSIDVELDKREIKNEITFPDCFVKSLTPVSGVAESYQENNILGIIWADGAEKEEPIEGAVFDIELPDGSVKREAVQKVSDEDGFDYYELDGEEIYCWVDTEEGMIEIYYMDITISQPIEIIPYPITGVKIDNVATNDAFEAESISYTVTLNDGTSQSFTFIPEGQNAIVIMGFNGYVTEPIEGLPVMITVGKAYGDEYPLREYMGVGIMADVDIMDTVEIEGPEQEGNILGEIIFKIVSFIKKIIALIMPVSAVV